MDPVIEVVALFLGFVSWIMVGIAIPNRYWKVSSIDGTVITTSTLYENLWMSCATDSLGVHNCREFPSLLALSGYIQASRALMIAAVVSGTFGVVATLIGYIQASRALMIAAVVSGTFGVVATLIGMQCSKAAGDNYVLKGRIAGTGGAFYLLQGLCTMISVSWYAANITQEFFNPLYPGQKYEIGEGLYIGWASGVLAICGGACLMFSCKLGTKEKTYYQPTRETAYSASASKRDAQSTYGRNAYV
ncbi:claudin-15-like [Sinocyclocheilus grahami]|uniref:claudin-15-like n=1 Tax=Sinocyclocheilus grahami TaxID=75366 RepID=UPI0007ACCAFE|nr:PREDICTED: claudin-15-like [Sinocyclocheilus grahami]